MVYFLIGLWVLTGALMMDKEAENVGFFKKVFIVFAWPALLVYLLYEISKEIKELNEKLKK